MENPMTRPSFALVVVVGLALAFSVLVAGCGGEAPHSVETAPAGAVLDTVALTVEGMT